MQTSSRASSLPRNALDTDSVKLYEQVATRLWDELRAAEARPGDRLPSERVLTDRFQVSRVTMRSALHALAARGVVLSAAARGWFVSESVHTVSPRAHVEGFAEYAQKHRIPTSAEVRLARTRPCTVRESEQLSIAPGASLFEMRRLRSLDGLVVVLEHNRLPLALCPALANTDFRTASLYATLLTADPPQVPRRAEYAVEARSPNPEERRMLDLEDSSVPVLQASQLTYSQHGNPMELTDQVYRGDRYQLRAVIA